MIFKTNSNNWKPNIQRCLQEQWTRITLLLNELPDQDHINYEELTERQQHCIQYIEAIEGEWIVDDEQREELSVLVFD